MFVKLKYQYRSIIVDVVATKFVVNALKRELIMKELVTYALLE
jgi:hypothetical protein